MNTLAFMPWLIIKENLHSHGIILHQYKKGQQPFGENNELQGQADKILGCYKTRRGFAKNQYRSINEAVIISMEGKEPNSELSDDDCNNLYDFNLFLACAALGNRSFFSVVNYCNSSNFDLVVQNYNPLSSSAGLKIITRRRDGTKANMISWDAYSELQPHYVDDYSPVEIDFDLLLALCKAKETLVRDVTQPKKWVDFQDAIRSFVRANSDSNRIFLQDEMVLFLSAFQRLLMCKSSDVDELSTNFLDLYQAELQIIANETDRCGGEKRKANSGSITEAWIRDFCKMRNEFAHGKYNSNLKFYWNIHEHLLLASFVFPILLKQRLEKDEYYLMSKYDVAFKRSFERIASESEILREIPDQNGDERFIWSKIVFDELFNANLQIESE